MKRFVHLLALTTVTGTAAVAHAAEAVATQAWWQSMLLNVVTGVAAAATPILSVLFMRLLRKLHLKAEQGNVDWIVKQGVNLGEQLAKRAAHTGQTMTNEEIKTQAVTFAQDLASRYAPAAAKHLADLIEAKLGASVPPRGAGGGALPQGPAA